MNSKKKVGIALGCGTARGFAHIGVLKVLEDENIPINYIAGSSIGAIVGTLYALGYGAYEIEKMASDFGLKRMAFVSNPSFSGSGLLEGRTIEKILKPIIGHRTFEDLKIPLKIVSTDICSGEEVIFTDGLLLKALRASASFPGLFVPMKYNNTYLVDGGLINPVPANIVKRMGAECVIAVDVTRNVKDYTRFMRQKKEKNIKTETDKDSTSNVSVNWLSSFDVLLQRNKQWVPNIVNVLLQTVYIAEQKIADSQLHSTHIDVAISPDLGHFTMFDFKKAHQIIHCGEKAAKDKLPVLLNALSR
ncbi:MAG: patatin-like phospholipase family protein [Candidatus Auribacterota bacterium]